MKYYQYRFPKIGEIWQDDRGPFLVTAEHKLTPRDKSVGYVCAIGIIDMKNGVTTSHWEISDLMLEEMTFVA
jgi:hypothetical protein